VPWIIARLVATLACFFAALVAIAGFSGIDFPTIYVKNRGEHCLIVLDNGEQLPSQDLNPVLVSDHKRWVAMASAGGCQIVNGQHVPVRWSIAVEPSVDAGRTTLTIQTAMGRIYLVNLVAVGAMDRPSPQGPQLVGFFLWHPPVPIVRHHSSSRFHLAGTDGTGHTAAEALSVARHHPRPCSIHRKIVLKLRDTGCRCTSVLMPTVNSQGGRR
jgi:hypothetical protein